jgi:Holliday junction resolvase
MANTARKGNSKELRSARLLEGEGYVVASRRHTSGPGDLLAVDGVHAPVLAEVKVGKSSPYENFRSHDRQAMREYAEAFNLEAVLLFWPPRAHRHRVIPEEEWPE